MKQIIFNQYPRTELCIVYCNQYTIHILINIPGSKDNQAMRFDQLIKNNMIFFSKNHTHGDTSPRTFLSKIKID